MEAGVTFQNSQSYDMAKEGFSLLFKAPEPVFLPLPEAVCPVSSLLGGPQDDGVPSS